MHAVVRASLQSILNLTRSTHALCAKLQYLSWPIRGRREQLWRLQCDEGHGRKTHRSPVSTAERLAVTKYCCKLLFGKPDSVSLFRRCVKPDVYAVFLRLPCESIPQRQLFHLADKLITAREINAHVRPACTGGCAYSTRVLFWWRNLRHAHCTLSLTYTYKVKYIWPLD